MSVANALPISDLQEEWVGTGANYLRVDDPVGSPDDNTTYISTLPASTSLVTDHYGFTAFSIPSGSIDISVSVFIRLKNTSPSYPASYKAVLRVNGTEYPVSVSTVGTSWTNRQHEWTVNPNTSAAWTVNDVNGSGSNPLQRFGVAGLSGAYYSEKSGWTYYPGHCTQCYCFVTYTEPAGGTGYAIIGGVGVVPGNQSTFMG